MPYLRKHRAPLGQAFDTAPNGLSRIYIEVGYFWRPLCTALSYGNGRFRFFFGWFDLPERRFHAKFGRRTMIAFKNAHFALFFG